MWGAARDADGTIRFPLEDDAGYKPTRGKRTENQKLAMDQHLIAKRRIKSQKFDLDYEMKRVIREDIGRYRDLLRDAERNARLPVPAGYNNIDNVKIITSIITELERCLREVENANRS